MIKSSINRIIESAGLKVSKHFVDIEVGLKTAPIVAGLGFASMGVAIALNALHIYRKNATKNQGVSN